MLFIKAKNPKPFKCPSPGDWISKLVYPQNSILFSNKTWTTCEDMDEIQKYYAR
jgi:hypothetical protein